MHRSPIPLALALLLIPFGSAHACGGGGDALLAILLMGLHGISMLVLIAGGHALALKGRVSLERGRSIPVVYWLGVLGMMVLIGKFLPSGTPDLFVLGLGLTVPALVSLALTPSRAGRLHAVSGHPLWLGLIVLGFALFGNTILVGSGRSFELSMLVLMVPGLIPLVLLRQALTRVIPPRP